MTINLSIPLFIRSIKLDVSPQTARNPTMFNCRCVVSYSVGGVTGSMTFTAKAETTTDLVLSAAESIRAALERPGARIAVEADEC